MSVDSIAAYAAQTQGASQTEAGAATNASSTGNTGQLNQNEFLQLMVAQLKNQNPTQPLDPTQFVGQLAQFSTVTGIENMQSSVQNLATSMRSSQVMSGTSLVGREVLAPADKTTIGAGGAVTGAADVPDGTTSVQVQVLDAGGQQVRTFAVVPQSGQTNFTWDGRTDTGAAAAAGTYTFKIVATSNGSSTSLDPMLQSKVNSVTINPSSKDLTLNTDAGALDLSTVRQVM